MHKYFGQGLQRKPRMRGHMGRAELQRKARLSGGNTRTSITPALKLPPRKAAKKMNSIKFIHTFAKPLFWRDT